MKVRRARSPYLELAMIGPIGPGGPSLSDRSGGAPPGVRSGGDPLPPEPPPAKTPYEIALAQFTNLPKDEQTEETRRLFRLADPDRILLEKVKKMLEDGYN